MTRCSFTCSDQRARSPVTRMTCLATITHTHAHTANCRMRGTSHPPPDRCLYCREQRSALSLYLLPPPELHSASVRNARVFRTEQQNPCVDLPRSIENHATSRRRCRGRWVTLLFSHFALRPDTWRHRRTRSLQQFNSASYTSMQKKKRITEGQSASVICIARQKQGPFWMQNASLYETRQSSHD